MGIGGKIKFVACFAAIAFAAAIRGACPPGALIQPCVCIRNRYPATVLCSNFSSASDLEEVMGQTYDYPVRGIRMSGACMLFFPSSVLLSKKTERVDLEDSVLVSLFDMTPDPENVVTHIRLSNTRLMRGVSWDLFRTLRDLQELKLVFVEVRKVGTSFRKNVNRNLRSLALVSSKTRRIEGDAFRDLSQLEVLRITGTQVSFLERSMFADPSRLVQLDLSENLIESFPSDMFMSMPRLQEVILKGNRITNLEEETFRNLLYYNIFRIDLVGNPLACICSLQWFLSTNKRLLIYGNCAVPSTITGKEIMNLADRDFDYCD